MRKKGIFFILVLSLLSSGCMEKLDELSEKAQEFMTEDAPQETDYPVHETLTSSFYYDELSEEQKSIYESLMQAKDSYASHVDFSGAAQDDFVVAYEAFTLDNPLVFWGQTYTWTGYSDGAVITSLDYGETGDYAAAAAQIEQAAQQVIASVPSGTDTYGKVKYFYEWIIQNTDYGNSEHSQDVRSVFLDHVSVCSGYAKAFKVLCDLSGIPCAVVQGTANNESHAWNLVDIDGILTWVDPTWGDPVYLNESDGSNINYNYLCVPDDLLKLTHTISTSAGSSDHRVENVFSYPSCSDWSLEYYVRNGCFFDSYDRLSLYSWFNAQLDAGRLSDIAFQYSNDTAYQEAATDLFDGGYMRTILAERYNSVTIRYETDDTLRVISVSLEEF